MSARSRRRVHAVGAYGMGNFGDDLFTATVRQQSGKLWPGATVRTFAPTAVGVYARSTPLGRALRVLLATVGFLWADTVAMCGGSILQDVTGVDRLRQRLLRFRRFEALGVSVGPFDSPEAVRRVTLSLSQLSWLVVRDTRSAEVFGNLVPNAPAPRVGGDLVALNESIRVHPTVAGLITVCPSAAAVSDPAELATRIQSALVAAQDARATPNIVRLLALASTPASNDVPLCHDLSRRLSAAGWTVEVQTYGEMGLEGTLKSIAESSMVWSQRLHGAIVAYLTEVPFLLEGHHQKCLDFGQDVGMHPSTLVPRGAQWLEAAKHLSTHGSSVTLPAHEYRANAREAYSAAPDGGNPRRACSSDE